MLKNSSILITGGTGSFGHAFVKMTLQKYKMTLQIDKMTPVKLTE